MTIKTFRGLMADDTQDTINLHTNDGKTGYRVVKFQALSNYPRGAGPECVLKIYKVAQSGTMTDLIDFSDQTLLAALFYEGNPNDYYTNQTDVIFDREIFNQDIYITCRVDDGTMNYYLELEQVSLDLNETTVATLQNVREHTPYNNPT
jgi:hypothetical protein